MIAPWPGIKTRHGAESPNGARIGKRNGGAFKILHRQFVVAGAEDNVVECLDELREVHGSRHL